MSGVISVQMAASGTGFISSKAVRLFDGSVAAAPRVLRAVKTAASHVDARQRPRSERRAAGSTQPGPSRRVRDRRTMFMPSSRALFTRSSCYGATFTSSHARKSWSIRKVSRNQIAWTEGFIRASTSRQCGYYCAESADRVYPLWFNMLRTVITTFFPVIQLLWVLGISPFS